MPLHVVRADTDGSQDLVTRFICPHPPGVLHVGAPFPSLDCWSPSQASCARLGVDRGTGTAGSRVVPGAGLVGTVIGVGGRGPSRDVVVGGDFVGVAVRS